MPESKDSSLTGAQGDSTIAFGYIKVLKARKRRFFVLKSVPKASPWELEGTKAPIDYYLYMYKNEKSHQKSEPKQVYNLNNVILLSRCTKKDNNTVLGICFQDDALFLKFTSEDELNRWYFHLSEIYSIKRNCRWPELLHCFNVCLKAKDLAATSARHGKTNLAGQYRLCLTDTAVLLVKDNLLSPALCLPFRCIRSLAQSISATFFQIHLGRLSPIGDGVLHFEVEQSCMLKEVTDTLMRCLNDSSSRSAMDGSNIVNRTGRRSSRDSVHRTGSFQTVLRRGSNAKNAKQHSANSISTCSERAPNTYSSSALLIDGQRTHSQPLDENFDDYCDLSLPGTKAASWSQNSSTSLSVNSELTGVEAEKAPSATLQQQQLQVQQRLHQKPPSLSGIDESSRQVSSWRFDSLDAGLSSCEEALGSSSLSSRANSIGSRPTSRIGSYLSASYSVPSSCCGQVSQTGGHRDDRQVFVEVNFPRPRTTSDASRYRLGGSRFRPRTGSYGNRSANRLATQMDDAAAELGPGSELQSLRESCLKEDDPYVPMTLGPSAPPAPSETPEEDPYWVSPTPLDCVVSPALAAPQCPVEH